jgi:tetratricopeptide (TPR) repeat protein
MSFKPWKQPLLAAFAMVAGTTAATAQNVQTAQRAIELGRYNEARALLRPGSTPETAFELGRLYQMRDMPDSAAIFFNKAAGTTPFGQVAAGRALLAKGQVAPAETQFDAAAKATKSKDAAILTLIAQAYGESDSKDVSKAQTYLTAAQTANKGKVDPALMVARGDIFLHSDQGGGEAMNSYDQAVAANPSYAQAYYKRGALSVRSRNFNAARESLNKAVELDPSYAPAYRELADMYYYAGQYDLALSTFQKYIGLAEKSPATDAQYASFLYLTKKYPDALTEVNKVLVSDPNNLTMNRLKPYLLYETGDYAGAGTAMDTYMSVAPADKIISEDLAYKYKIMSKTGKGNEAIAGISDLIKKDPSKACDFQNDLAAIYANQKDYKGAARVYSYKLTNCKGDLTDQFRLATAYTGDKQYTRADSVYNIILTAKPTYAPGYLNRAQVNNSLDPEGKKGLAKPYYEKYIELSKAEGADPTKFKSGVIEANGQLGLYSANAGDKAAAIRYFEQVLVVDPGNKGAQENIKILQAPARTAKAPAKAPVKKK